MINIQYFKSKGFQYRLKHWYLPLLKMGLTYLYRKAHGYFERQDAIKHGVQVKEKDIDKQKYGVVELPATGVQDHSISYEQARVLILKLLINHEPQKLGTCVAHTMVNMARFVTKAVLNADISLAEGDVYIDRQTKGIGIDAGMYPDATIPRVATKGIGIAGTVPTAQNMEELKKITRDKYPDDKLAPYRIKLYKSHKYITRGQGDFESIWAYMNEQFGKGIIKPFQISIRSYYGMWGTDEPTATGSVYGSHSLFGITIPFKYKGERAFFVYDSSYKRGTFWRVARGIRIMRENSAWKLAGTSARAIEWIPVIEDGLKRTEPTPELVIGMAKYGDNNQIVANIQKALMSLGYDIPAISSGQAKYGYYGNQTAVAVKRWQTDNWLKFYKRNPYWNVDNLESLEGKHFGQLSVDIMLEMLK